MSGAWGPFRDGQAADERKASFRALRTATKLLTGPRGDAACFALLRAEISGGDLDLIGQAEAEFDRLAPLDRRRVMAAFASVNFAKAV